jgi:hypothetical protein
MVVVEEEIKVEAGPSEDLVEETVGIALEMVERQFLVKEIMVVVVEPGMALEEVAALELLELHLQMEMGSQEEMDLHPLFLGLQLRMQEAAVVVGPHQQDLVELVEEALDQLALEEMELVVRVVAAVDLGELQHLVMADLE